MMIEMRMNLACPLERSGIFILILIQDFYLVDDDHPRDNVSDDDRGDKDVEQAQGRGFEIHELHCFVMEKRGKELTPRLFNNILALSHFPRCSVKW